MALEYLGQTIPKLVELSSTERELNHDCPLLAKDRKCVFLELDNGVVREELEAFDSPVARFGLVIQLDVVSVEAKRDVLRLRRLPTLQEQVTLGVELGICKPDEPEIQILLDRHASGFEVAAHDPSA